jgi:hypothetical protein
LQAAQERRAHYRVRKLGPAQWEVLVDGEPCGLIIQRISNSRTRWEWMVLNQERTVVASAWKGGVQAVLEELAWEPEIIANAGAR